MFLNLLANAMDSSMDDVVRPSYVTIIEQMDRLDAIIFSRLATIAEYTKVICPVIEIVGTDKIKGHATPEWFLGWNVDSYSVYDISASLIRLRRLELIELFDDKFIKNIHYDDLENHPILLQILNQYRRIEPSSELRLEIKKGSISVNDFGRRFAKCCCL